MPSENRISAFAWRAHGELRTLLYFSVSGLDLLGKLDQLDRDATVEYIYSFQSDCPDHGGFYGYPKAGLGCPCWRILPLASGDGSLFVSLQGAL